MLEGEFENWLKWRGATSEAAIKSRIFAVRKIEESLPALGSPYSSLDEAFEADGFATLRARLKEIREDAQKGGQDFRLLMPDSENPLNRLANWRSWLGQYGQFLTGADQPEDSDKFDQAMEQLRATFLARMDQFDDLAADYGSFWDSEKSYKQNARGAVVAINADPQRSAAERGKAIYERLCQNAGQGLPLSWRTKGEVFAASPDLQTRFFETIASLGNPEEDAGILAEQAARSLEQLREDGIANLKRGEVLNIVLSVLGTFRPKDSCWFKSRLLNQAAKHLSCPRLFPSDRFELDEFEKFQSFMLKVQSWLDDREMKPENFEDVQGFLWVALAWEEQELVVEGLTRAAVEAAMDQFDEIGLDGFRGKYGFGKPQTYWVRRPSNGKLYPAKATVGVAHGHVEGGKPRKAGEFYGGQGEQAANGILRGLGYEIVTGNSPETGVPDTLQPYQPQQPTNLILYGPPGTGKTYRTAREAVALCDGIADFPETPEGRAALLARYRELEGEKRIAFVTFHQNYDYETFVEGLRPETGGDETSSAGFRLEPKAGIFREICALAEQARTRTRVQTGASELDFTGRRFWKMGQGAIGTEDDVYEEALANSYVALGWGGAIDWSPERFSSFDAIKAEWLERNPDDQTPSNWTQTYPFRCEMKAGDIVIVPYGNTAFRAVAEVTGDYYFVPSAEGYYAHRRPVRWLLTLDDPLPLDTIVDGNFTMRTLYSLASKRVNTPALGRLLAGEEGQDSGEEVQGQPDQFVLIIDEINRANISKVFGELITLLEPDKRLGMPNALTVTLPYSKKKDFGVPANLHIVGTMNTADRSIALLDTALRRRFTFREIAPEPRLLGRVDNIDLRAVLETINDRVEYLIDREHRLGHAFFIACEDRAAIDAAMRDKVVPLLQEYFFEDWGRIAAVLGEGFIGKRTLKCPMGEGEDRDSWFVRGDGGSAFPVDAYDRLLGNAPAVSAIGPEDGEP